MEKTKIYIYGSGGHSLVVSEIAKRVGYSEVVFLDDFKFDGQNILKFDENLPKWDLIVAVGDNKIRQILQNKARELGFNIVSLIDPSAFVSKSAKVLPGSVVMPKAVINANAFVGSGVIVNSASVIEHECVLGDFSHISPNVALAGGVKIGDFTHIGIGSCVIQNIKIGKNCIVGAGSVVVKDFGDELLIYGNPAKIR